ncbi:hypothetical protein [Wolbachia pipientis]|uniref:hypothetical protein n=1 Tax=Wolbachia pipientis TaxID=955 RepID=UPI0025A47073|nr:hypothetical protein [Wolbachia pipientis]MDM8335711.1 hypothetical protein [Wolbachia pipientis]
MNKNNIEFYSGKEVSQKSELHKLQKPEFIKPEMKEISTSKGKFNITQNMKQEDIDNVQPIGLNVKYPKYFYDGLMHSINTYNNDMDTAIKKGMVEPHSLTTDSIGQRTSNIKSELKKLWEKMPEIAEAFLSPHVTEEENILL